ncbi:hypothetical protein [Filimonas effusa]|uniref:Uncharacterized protein n=1 Tax=Filimonas effusa TaxID=2508721 RepID=A0A4Q1D9L5_9BACT|nr:hypothetical protein [Filimonas effusa]RXK86087.1 hypothetical protein ESB13_04555 [Filimonas effusa]
METKIKWLSDFYGWEKIDPESNHFNNSDYVSINGDVQQLRVNPTIAKHHMFRASNLKLFTGPDGNGFHLYQCDSPSEVRKNIPLRFFYSKEYGKAFELNGSNTPIYELWNFIRNNPAVKKSILGAEGEWISNEKNIPDCIRLFFDNVRGKHGRFEIIHWYQSDKLVSSYSLFSNRIKKYYEINNDKEWDSQTSAENETNQVFHEYLSHYFNQLDSQAYAIKLTSEDSDKQQGSFAIWKECHMVFQNSIFTADVSLNIEENNFGSISLSNERQLSCYDVYQGDRETLSASETDMLKGQTEIYPLKN